MRYLLAVIFVLCLPVITFAGSHSCSSNSAGIQGCSVFNCQWDTGAAGSVPDVTIHHSGAVTQVSTKPVGTVTSYNITFTDNYGIEILENNLDSRSTTSAEEVEFAPVEVYTGPLTISVSDTTASEQGKYKFILCH